MNWRPAPIPKPTPKPGPIDLVGIMFPPRAWRGHGRLITAHRSRRDDPMVVAAFCVLDI